MIEKKNILIAYFRLFNARLKEHMRNSRCGRYKYLIEIIKKKKCRRIMEIGTYNGGRALQMIEVAKKYHGAKVEYYGFDLFELLNEEKAKIEYAKIPPMESVVKDKLKPAGVKIHLFKGDTKETLPWVINILPKMDLIFIDGGHSIDTIRNDWEYARRLMHENTVVLFDDYWDTDSAGCKPVVEDINTSQYDLKIIRTQNRLKKEWGGLKISLVRVMKKFI